MCGNPGTRVPVSAGTRVPGSGYGSGSALTAPHPVGYPVPNFEAGVHLYDVFKVAANFWGIYTSIKWRFYIGGTAAELDYNSSSYVQKKLARGPAAPNGHA